MPDLTPQSNADRAQTKRIVTSMGRRKKSPGEVGDVDALIRRHHAAQRLLFKCRVAIPFADRLAEQFPVERTDARRTFGQVLSLIEAVTLLHQYQRIGNPVDGVLIKATPEDYSLARTLIAEPIARSMTSDVSAAALNFCDRLRENFAGRTFNTREATERETVIGSVQTVRSHLNALATNGLLAQIEPSRGPTPAKYRVGGAVDSAGVVGLPSVEKVCS